MAAFQKMLKMQFISCSFHLSEQQHLWRSEMAKPVRWRREMNRELHFHWWKEDNDDGDEELKMMMIVMVKRK